MNSPARYRKTAPLYALQAEMRLLKLKISLKESSLQNFGATDSSPHHTPRFFLRIARSTSYL